MKRLTEYPTDGVSLQDGRSNPMRPLTVDKAGGQTVEHVYGEIFEEKERECDLMAFGEDRLEFAVRKLMLLRNRQKDIRWKIRKEVAVGANVNLIEQYENERHLTILEISHLEESLRDMQQAQRATQMARRRLERALAMLEPHLVEKRQD